MTTNAPRQPFPSEDRIKAEYQLIAGGQAFWCETCLCARPVRARSPDPRYCQDCYTFLVEETKMLAERGQWKRPAWIPNPLPEDVRGLLQAVRRGSKAVTEDITLSGDSTEDVTAPSTSQNVDAAIARLSDEGLSTRQIAEQLGMFGKPVSHMTVVRHLRRTQ